MIAKCAPPWGGIALVLCLLHKEGTMKKIAIFAVLLAVVCAIGCEKKSTIETPAGKITVTQ